MNGILIVNKPKNITSRDVVNKICKIYHTKKVGHTGTLDPIATGVLIVCLGSYTKLVNYITSEYKEYIATMKLGCISDTLDTESKISKTTYNPLSKEDILKVFRNFPKEYDQEVPKYSAVKINGKKLYEYARKNEEIKLPKRPVEIKSLEILDMNDDEITLKTCVSKGTYIRSLILDLAKSLKTTAIMTKLHRTKQGNISIDMAINLENINEDTPLLNYEIFFKCSKVIANENMYKGVQNGNILNIDSDEKYIVINYMEKDLAIYEKKIDGYHILLNLIDRK